MQTAPIGPIQFASVAAARRSWRRRWRCLSAAPIVALISPPRKRHLRGAAALSSAQLCGAIEVDKKWRIRATRRQLFRVELILLLLFRAPLCFHVCAVFVDSLDLAPATLALRNDVFVVFCLASSANSGAYLGGASRTRLNFAARKTNAAAELRTRQVVLRRDGRRCRCCCGGTTRRCAGQGRGRLCLPCALLPPRQKRLARRS